MNTYDPMDRIVYRHIEQQPIGYSVPVPSTRGVHPLPAGYANGSPRTYLGRTHSTPQAA